MTDPCRAAQQKVIDILCELKEVTPEDVIYALGAYEAVRDNVQPVELGKNDYDIMFQLLEPYLDKLIYADTRANGEAFWHCSRYEVLAACKDICEQIAATHPEREATQTCIESIIRRQATGWVMDNEQPIADYLFAKAEEMASAILAVYPPTPPKRESSEAPAGAALVKTTDEIWGRPPQNSDCVYAQQHNGIWCEVLKFNDVEGGK